MKFPIKSVSGRVLFEAEIADDTKTAYRMKMALRVALSADAYLGDANLRGANLRDAYLCDAYLCDANLGGANLCGTNVIDAGQDQRGYRFVARNGKPPMIVAGCRWFTFAEAREHWGAANYDSGPDVQAECQAKLDLLETVARARGWNIDTETEREAA